MIFISKVNEKEFIILNIFLLLEHNLFKLSVKILSDYIILKQTIEKYYIYWFCKPFIVEYSRELFLRSFKIYLY
jgi:hypothetical protein